MDMKKDTALQKALDNADGGSKLALALGITPQAISQWKKCPPGRALKVAALTGVPPHELCPEMYPAPDTDEAALLR